MADSDKILSLAIQLKVLGKEDAAALRDLLTETQAQAADMSTYLPESWDKEKKALDESGEAARGSAAKHRALHALLEKLNEVIPGLGTALGLLAKGYHESEAAAEAGAVANKSFIASMGPLALVFLAIQTATTYWELYEDKVKHATEAQTAALDKTRETLRAAFKEQAGFNAELDKAKAPADQFAEALGNVNAVLDAQYQVRKQLLGLDKADELAKAQTPAQKAEVEAKYAGLSSDLDSKNAAAHIQALTNVMAVLQTEITNDTIKRSELEEKRIAASKSGSIVEVGALNTQIDALDKRITDDTGKFSGYERQRGRAQNVAGIADDGRTFADNRPISRAVEGIDAAAHGQRLTAEQVKANQELTQIFAAQSGGLQVMTSVIRAHLQLSTSTAQEVKALANALASLKAQTRSSAGFNHR